MINIKNMFKDGRVDIIDNEDGSTEVKFDDDNYIDEIKNIKHQYIENAKITKGLSKKVIMLYTKDPLEDIVLACLIRKPTRKEFMNFQFNYQKNMAYVDKDKTIMSPESQQKLYDMVEGLIKECLLYPSKEEFDEYLDEYFSSFSSVIEQLLYITGVPMVAKSKKG